MPYIPHMPITLCADMRQLLQSARWPGALVHIISHYWHMPLTAACHTAHICSTARLLYSAYSPYITAHIIKNQLTATFIYHTTAKYLPATHMPLKCQMPKLLDVNLWWKYANIYAMDEVAVINDIARTAVYRWWWCWCWCQQQWWWWHSMITYTESATWVNQ